MVPLHAACHHVMRVHPAWQSFVSLLLVVETEQQSACRPYSQAYVHVYTQGPPSVPDSSCARDQLYAGLCCQTPTQGQHRHQRQQQQHREVHLCYLPSTLSQPEGGIHQGSQLAGPCKIFTPHHHAFPSESPHEAVRGTLHKRHCNQGDVFESVWLQRTLQDC